MFGLLHSSLHCPVLAKILPSQFSQKPPVWASGHSPDLMEALILHHPTDISSPWLVFSKNPVGWLTQNPPSPCCRNFLPTEPTLLLSYKLPLILVFRIEPSSILRSLSPYCNICCCFSWIKYVFTTLLLNSSFSLTPQGNYFEFNSRGKKNKMSVPWFCPVMSLQQLEQDLFTTEMPWVFVEWRKEWLIKLVPRLGHEGFVCGGRWRSAECHAQPKPQR